jgi:glycosyltransferase involved in cell wall biosynthesis
MQGDKMINYEFPQMKYPEQKGLISIIVPIYNNEIYLKECLDSISAQTLANWEAILVNDGSTDGTEKIISEYAKKDSRFIAVHKQNEGTLLARKTGLENSRGEFIANIDHDDTYDPQFLEKMLAKITETNSDFAWCQNNGRPGFNITDYKWNADASINTAMILMRSQGTACYTWNKLIKREIYAKVNFPMINITLNEDLIQMFQAAYHSKSAAFVPENLYFHREYGFANSGLKPISSVKSTIILKNTLEVFFDGKIPQNVAEAFYRLETYTSYCYFLLDKKTREEFRNEFEPILPELIKRTKKINLKIVLLLASKGIEWPLKLRECIRKMHSKMEV